MERPQYIRSILIILFFLFQTLLKAQSPYAIKIYESYLDGNMEKWKEVITEMEKYPPVSRHERKELLNYYYGYIGYLVSMKKQKEAKEYLAKGEELIEQLLNNDPADATAFAYKGSFLGFRLAMSKIKAPILGPQSMKYINKAYEIDPLDIQVIADKANLLYYSPGIVGGNKKEAIRLYQVAIHQIEENRMTRNNWFYLSLQTSLAQHYEEMNEYEKAIKIYRKILQQAPSYKWVRDELYPSLAAKMS